MERATTPVERLRGVSGRMRDRIGKVASHDPVTEDLFIEVRNKIEEQAWMMQAQPTALL